MIDNHLATLGVRVAQLRFSKRMKQSELAYEAGVSLRTLQRLEAGQIVRSDVLLKVIARLGKLDDLLMALETSEFSPYDMLTNAGISPAQLQDRPTIPLQGDDQNDISVSGARKARHNRRVRHAAGGEAISGKPDKDRTQKATVQWPEDQ